MASDLEFSATLGRKIKGLSDSTFTDFQNWPTPDEGAFSDEDRALYLKRKFAIKMYLSGSPINEIQEKFGFGRSHVYRMVTERCLEKHPDGLIYGWRGLVPNLRIKPYLRKNKIIIDDFGYGAVGAMQTVLNLHPELHKRFKKRILESPKTDKLGVSKRSQQAHWVWFINELRNYGYEIRNEWPFNTVNNGYVSVCNYIKEVLSSNPQKAARVLGGIESERKLISGDGVKRPVHKAFQRVEMDAHKIDLRICILMPTRFGDYVPKIIHRIWVIVIIDVLSRAVLGYYMSMGRETSKDDVLRAIKMALTPWRRKVLTFCDEKDAYETGAGLPSGISEDFVGICWDETSVDGALAETCKHVEKILNDVVGSTLISPKKGYSSRRGLDDRPNIERFFLSLTSKGVQRFSNTTGSKPKAKKGRDPDKIATESQFQLEYLEELLDVFIANYNATPHVNLGYKPPIECLKLYYSNNPDSFRHVEPNTVQKILVYRKKCQVNGSLTEGRRPFVNFEGAKYTNETLQQ